MTLNEFNQLDTPSARYQLRQCCVSDAWIEAMLTARPFTTAAQLFSTAERIWAALTQQDYLQAFEGHPKIGDVGSLRAKYADSKALAAGEQASVNHADEATLQALAAGNQAYEERFGFIFIVCATGKSAAEMLALLQARLENDRNTEIQLAAAEQQKITQIRLAKLLQDTVMPRISSHILDTTLGKPAAGIRVQLFKCQPDQSWIMLNEETTNTDGRIANLLKDTQPLENTRYRLRFHLQDYFVQQQQPCFYPQVEIECQLDAEAAHYHIPLLVSPFGYSTYRGS